MRVTVHVEHDGKEKQTPKKGTNAHGSASPSGSMSRPSPGTQRPSAATPASSAPPLPQNVAGTATRPTFGSASKATPASSVRTQRPASSRATGSTSKASARSGSAASGRASSGSTSSSSPKAKSTKPATGQTQKTGSVTSAKAGGANPNGKAGTTKTRTSSRQPSLPKSGTIAGPLLGTRGPMTTSGNSAAPLASDPGNPPSNQLNQQTAAQPVGSMLPPTPPKEPKPTNQTSAMRQRQTQVLRARQNRELAGQTSGAPRDVDAGAGFWPPLSPLL